MKRLTSILFSLFLGVSAYSFAISGDAILRKVDKAYSPGRDAVGISIMKIIDPSGIVKVRTIKMYRKGTEKRLIKFLSPADVKGVGFLVLSDNDMYLYLPTYRRIRRIASHVKNESFMGSDFSYDDMGTAEFSKYYKGRLIKETPEYYIVEAIRKPGADKEYSKLIMKVDKKTYLPIEVKFYKNGVQIKESKILGIKNMGGYPTPTHVVMKTIKTGHKTELIIKNIRYNVGLRNKIFTKRYLKKREI